MINKIMELREGMREVIYREVTSQRSPGTVKTVLPIPLHTDDTEDCFITVQDGYITMVLKIKEMTKKEAKSELHSLCPENKNLEFSLSENECHALMKLLSNGVAGHEEYIKRYENEDSIIQRSKDDLQYLRNIMNRLELSVCWREYRKNDNEN